MAGYERATDEDLADRHDERAAGERDGAGPAPGSGTAGAGGAPDAAPGGAEAAEGGGEAAGEPRPADPLTVALAERDEYLDALRRLQAEFDNFRKRVLSQQAEQAARGTALLVDKLLPVLDTLDLAVQHLGDGDSADGKALVATGNQLHGLLAKEGLERVDPLGEVFDPNAHEAVGHVPDEDGGSTDEDENASVAKPVVAQVLRPGYRWKGAVLRPAMVTVRG